MKKYVRFFRLSFFRAVNEPLTPHAISMGFAIGIAIGLGPTFGFQLIPAFLINSKLKYSRLGGILGVFITNPLTIIPIYTFELLLGMKLVGNWLQVEEGAFGRALAQNDYQLLIALGSETIFVFILGSLVVALFGGTASYFIIKPIVNGFKLAAKKAKQLKEKSKIIGYRRKVGEKVLAKRKEKTRRKKLKRQKLATGEILSPKKRQKI